VQLIALKEAFWCDKLATDGSPLSPLPVKPKVKAGQLGRARVTPTGTGRQEEQ
jgi:hypothetical protein